MPIPNPDNDVYPPIKPNPMRNLSEFAVADTPGTSGPAHEHVGGDYLTSRFVPTESAAASPHPPHQRRRETHAGEENQGGGMPTALGRGVPGGSGPVDDTERKATRYVDLEEAEREGVADRQNENVDADAQMEMYAEGKVAHAVKGARRRAAEAQHARGESPAGGGLHGRGRGEVTLQANEAGLER